MIGDEVLLLTKCKSFPVYMWNNNEGTIQETGYNVVQQSEDNVVQHSGYNVVQQSRYYMVQQLE